MQRQPYMPPGGGPAAQAPLVLLFERNDAVAVPLISQLRMAGYDVRAARIPVEVFDLLQHEPVQLVLIDLGNAAANRREFWVGLDTQRRGRTVHVLTFRYLTTGDTGTLEDGQRVARADVEIVGVQGFGPLIEAIRAQLPGVAPSQPWEGPPPNRHPPLGTPHATGAPWMPTGSAPLGNRPSGPPPPHYPGNGHYGTPSGPMPGQHPSQPAPAADSSPFATPYSDNPFKRRPGGGPGTPPPPPPQAARPLAPDPLPGAPWPPPGNAGFPPAPPSRPRSDHFQGFGAPPSAMPTPARPAMPPQVEDAWSPPTASATPTPSSRRGVAYRGYDEEPLAPDDPRIEGNTSEVPVAAFVGATASSRNERALSTILMDGAIISPQRLDALRMVQGTLESVGMNFSLAELAMLFKFLTPDQLLAAYLVSRGLVSPEQIASLGRIKQELLATGKDYDLEALLVMFNILPGEQVRLLRAELG